MSRDQHTEQSAWRDDNEAEALIDAIEGTEQSSIGPAAMSAWGHKPAEQSASYLVRIGAPSRGATIHRDSCPVIARAKGPALRWKWADTNPEIDWQIAAPWLKACKVCKPPSPACEAHDLAGERITHGRHCICSACAQEDWTNPDLAPCGMHGKDCPAFYQPWGRAGTYYDPANEVVEEDTRS